MANTILTPTAVTREALRVLHNSITFTKNVNRQYDDSFARTGAKIGDSLKIRLPNQFIVRTGATIDTQDINEKSVIIQVATQKGVDINFTSAELTLDMDTFSERILKPAMSRLASEVDFDGLTLYQDVYNQVGLPGSVPATALVVLEAGETLDDFSAPSDEMRFLCVNPAAHAAMVNGLKGLFHTGSEISKQYKKGRMGNALGFDWGMTQNINRHTTGAFAGTTLVDETLASGDTNVNVDDFTDAAPTVTKGDTFTMAGCNSVNPETKKDTGKLQRFTVTAAATGSSNEIDIAISPTLTTSGAYQTVTALPANDAAVTWSGTASTAYPMNIAHHRDAFTFVTADLEMPKGVDFSSRVVQDNMSMRIVRQYDIVNDKFPCRIDIFYTWKLVRPELACRVVG